MGIRVAAAFACLMSVAPQAAAAPPTVIALSAEDEAAYTQAFAAAEDGDAHALEAALRRVEDDALATQARGRLLLNTRSRADYGDLTRWLSAHAADPLAARVRQRALAVKPRHAPAPPAVIRPRVRPDPLRGSAIPPDPRRAAALDALAEGRFDEAEAMARSALDGPAAHAAAWTAGLLAFRRADHDLAANDFARAASAPSLDGWNAAAAHVWAARAAMAAGRAQEVLPHLEAAAARPTTFYGQLAEAMLGRTTPLDFTRPTLDQAKLDAFFTRHPGARRAAAYAQLGRLSDVERELAFVHGRLQPEDDPLFLALAEALAAPAAQLRAAEFGGPDVAAGFCPNATFEPADGFRLDRAVIFAVTRQESRFNPVAVSSSNARGLMQLLPSTAAWLTGERELRARPAPLHDPGFNMKLGQAYIESLQTQLAPAGGDLAKVFAAYNGGPGWLTRWLAAHPQDDPLLMLELMPRAETRDFAERVLSHLTLCRKRFGQNPTEMEALASGLWPAYAAQDGVQNAAATPAPQS